ncbi:acetyl-CoA carboxylase, biotin carboxyl carrier protein [candidate division KSB1 bacterium RBG_16_48_16]|nr:MAG: acetyl-CoA carboxylase, biotin carboxyl carrier protein [candidate division KSB1 bacterium RBG_16_48_16]
MRAKEIRELVRIVEQSNINEIEITRWWGRKIRISKAKGGQEMQVIHTTSPVIEARPSETPPPLPPEAKPPVEPPSFIESSNLIEIKAPMVGTFYRAPAHDAEAYVEEGDTVSPGKVLCIIEAMKLMNEIEAEISGQIVKVLAENAQPVEFNQPLFLVEPS